LHDPKAKLGDVLAKAGIGYTKEIAREIAAAANLEQLSYWCPSFERLRNAVRLA
jgi:hypothetical protein